MKVVYKVKRVFKRSPDINPKVVMDKWFCGTPISDDELKELEEFTRREGYSEYFWIIRECERRNVVPYEDVYVWNADLFAYGHWVNVDEGGINEEGDV